jgi:hypothetical protein
VRIGVSVAAVALLAAVPACASSGSTGAPSSTTTAPSGSRAVCAWKVRADRETLNIAYPDTSATYWGMRYALAPGEHLRLSGRFPAARYASFVSYGAAGGPIDVLTDRDIDPDPGNTNPFRASAAGATATNGTAARYTITIRPDTGPTDAPNVLGAATPGGSTTTTTTTTPGAEPVVVGGGGHAATSGNVIYRVYLPERSADPTGGAGLPHVTLVDASGTATPVRTCAAPGPSRAAIDIVNHLHRTFNPAPPTPIFIRPDAAQLNLYPNPDNVYVATIVAHRPGRVVVVRARAPTFPDTRRGAPVAGDEQVRFWSLCTNEVRKPYPVTDCVPDDRTMLDAAGYYTYVISTPADRPARTPATAVSTWLDWGSTKVDVLLLLRNMLASPSFAEAANSVAPGALATSTMGEYAPRGAYCAKATFEQGGAAACGL